MPRRRSSDDRKSPTPSWDEEQDRRDRNAEAITAAIQERQAVYHDRDRRWTPWLLIRYSPTDRGARPTAGAFWLSPDIWVESGDPSGNAVAGQDNFVHARLFNLGMIAAGPTQVDFYWANPALGLGAVNMNHIGTEWVEVAAMPSLDVRCSTPWVPQMVNGGHECLLVNCSNHLLHPIRSPFEPALDLTIGSISTES